MTAQTGVRDVSVSLNGLRFHYMDWGDLAAPPLVVLHGLAGDARSWCRFASAMTDHFRVIALDQRGHGETDWAPDYAQRRMDADVEAFRIALGIERMALLGQSMGGMNAYLYAARHPGIVERLVIGDFGPDVVHNPTSSIPAILEAAQQAVFDDPEQAVQAAQRVNPRPPLAEARTDTAGQLKQRADGRWVWRYDAAHVGGYRTTSPSEAEQWQLLATVTCPVLLVRGAESTILRRETAERMVRLMSSCQLVELAGSGHSVPRDNPPAFLAAVRPFLLGGADE